MKEIEICMSESRFLICPFSGNEHFITGGQECPDCKIRHEMPYFIKRKKTDWYRKKNQWLESAWHEGPKDGRKRRRK